MDKLIGSEQNAKGDKQARLCGKAFAAKTYVSGHEHTRDRKKQGKRDKASAYEAAKLYCLLEGVLCDLRRQAFKFGKND